MMRPLSVALACGASLLAIATTVSAASKRRADFPCAGCLTDLPDPLAPQTKAPMLVLLHGDGQGPLAVAPLFAKEAAARGIVLFVPRCPKDDGCTDARWWAWDKDPAWFDAQVDAIDAVQPIDRARLWLAGWSGGGSYIGRVAPALFGRFAAVAIVGGGMAPDAPSCPKTCALPAYFLVGDQNPYHALAKDLRAWFDGCAQEVVWELLPGKNHAGELAEISKPAREGEILDWMGKHARVCAGAGAEAGTETGTETEAETGTETETEAETGTGTEAEAGTSAGPAPAATRGRCGCGIVGERCEGGAGLAWVAAMVLAGLRAARRR